MILACAAVLHYASLRGAGDPAERASRAIYEAVLETTAAGIRTPDLGGHAATSQVAGETVGRVRAKLEAWDSLG
jgi:isocitrate dehydrogenase (NAD+)